MSKVAELACDKYRFDELADFADNVGVDFGDFADMFMYVVNTYADTAKTTGVYWILWNWLDCNGDIDIDYLAHSFYHGSFIGGSNAC